MVNPFQKELIMLNLLLAVVLAGTAAQDSVAENQDFFSGRWRIEAQALVITFLGGDSLKVTSPEDETIQGRGTYTMNDTSFTAEVVNNDMKLKMTYQYEILEDTSKIKARNKFFSVDGDTVNQPDIWTTMEKYESEDSVEVEEASKQESD